MKNLRKTGAVDWSLRAKSVDQLNVISTIVHDAETFEYEVTQCRTEPRAADSYQIFWNVIGALVLSMLQNTKPDEHLGIDYDSCPYEFDASNAPTVGSDDPRYSLELLTQDALGYFKAIVVTEPDDSLSLVTGIAGTEKFWALHEHFIEKSSGVEFNANTIANNEAAATKQSKKNSDTKVQNSLDHSRPLDVHTSSEHPEVNKFVNKIFETLRNKLGNERIRKKHLKVILLDLYLAWCDDPSLKTAYFRASDAYRAKSRYNELHISKITPHVVDELELAGYVNHIKGFSDRRSGIGRASRMWPTLELISLFEKAKFQPLDMVDFSNRESIILRKIDAETDKRVDLEYDDTPATNSMREQLHRYNSLIHQTFIDIPSLEENRLLLHAGEGHREKSLYINQRDKFTKRIFSRASFNKGGRFYGGWWQRCPREWRHAIFLNDNPVSEIDYSGLHMVMLYAEKDIDYWTEIGVDPYAVDFRLPGDHLMSLREICKRLTLVALNAKSEAEAFKAFRANAEDGSPEKRMDDADLRPILHALKARHDPIAEMFASDAGIDLMNRDSQITANILEWFTNEEIPALLIHDSYIVPFKYEAELTEQMQSAFAKVMGTENVKLSYEIHNPWNWEPLSNQDHVDHSAWETALQYRFDPPRSQRYLYELKRFNAWQSSHSAACE